MRAEQYWLEDFTPGRTFPGPSHVLDSEAFGMFAKMTGDAHPLHYDAEYAKKTAFGAPPADVDDGAGRDALVEQRGGFDGRLPRAGREVLEARAVG